MKLCKERNLQKLLGIIERKKLFSAKLKLTLFSCVTEILLNLCSRGSACQKCFPKSIMKKLKKQKGFVRQLLDTKTSLKKRKKKFLEADSKLKKLIYSVLKYFFENCVETCE